METTNLTGSVTESSQPTIGELGPSAGTATADFTPTQLVRMAEDAVKAGTLTQEQAADFLRKDAPAPIHEISTAGEAGEIDTAFPPGRPDQFVIPSLAVNGELSIEDLTLVQKGQSWLSEGRFTPAIGNYVAEECKRAAERCAPMNESQRELYRRSEQVNVEKIFGADADKMISLARGLVAEIDAKSPGLIDFLERTGAGDSAAVIVQFATHAARLEKRSEALEKVRAKF